MRGLATFQRTRKQHKLTKTLNEVGKNHVCNLIDKIQKEKIRAYANSPMNSFDAKVNIETIPGTTVIIISGWFFEMSLFMYIHVL